MNVSWRWSAHFTQRTFYLWGYSQQCTWSRRLDGPQNSGSNNVMWEKSVILDVYTITAVDSAAEVVWLVIGWPDLKGGDHDSFLSPLSLSCCTVESHLLMFYLKVLSSWGYVAPVFIVFRWDPHCVEWTVIYRGADKSLARPGRKQGRNHVRDARDFNNIETRAVKFFFFCKARHWRKFTPFWQKH